MAKREDKSVFNTLADRYDRWHETAQGAAAFREEIYSLAAFRTVTETTALAEKRGFGLCASASGLLWSPDDLPDAESCVKPCGRENASFVALRFRY